MSVVDLKKFEAVPLDKLVKADWNYKEQDAELTKKLVANMKRNGQLENIVVRRLDTGFFEIVNGNHRYDALVEIGAAEAVVFNLGDITLHQAQRIAIETNETRFATNTVKLAGIIGELLGEYSTEELEATMPYNQDRLKELADMANFDWNQYGEAEQGNDPSEAPGGTETVHITMEPVDAERWRAWCKRINRLTSGTDGDALMIALRVCEDLTDQDIESAVAG